MDIEQIKMRCTECGECWHWNGYGGLSGNHPQMKVNGKLKLVRRYAYELARGAIPPGLLLVPWCDNRKCINPDHMKAVTESQKGKRAAARGAFSSPARGRKIAESRRATSAKINMEIAAEIRMSEETGPVLAARYGINRSLVGCIKRGERWKDYANPYSTLGARA